MPIFQDDLGGGRATPPKKQTVSSPSNSPLGGKMIKRKISEESIRTELCEGLLLDSPPMEGGLKAGVLDDNFQFTVNRTSDRAELIERLKRGESPAWLPNRNVWLPIFLSFHHFIVTLY
jgi:hypothetical protein